DARVRIVEVAEDDGVGRAGLRAGARDLAVANGAIAFALGRDLRLLDALHAVRALLHDAAHAHGDVGVELHLPGLRNVAVHRLGGRPDRTALELEVVEAT